MKLFLWTYKPNIFIVIVYILFIVLCIYRIVYVYISIYISIYDIYTYIYIYIFIIYCDRICWVYKKLILFSFHSLIFHSKIHKRLGAFFERGWGNSSLKQNYVEGVRGRRYIRIKWTGMNKVGGVDQKLKVSSKHTFWMTPKSSLQLRYMIY